MKEGGLLESVAMESQKSEARILGAKEDLINFVADLKDKQEILLLLWLQVWKNQWKRFNASILRSQFKDWRKSHRAIAEPILSLRLREVHVELSQKSLLCRSST